MKEDSELLRQYTETGSEDAFTELVRRYLPLVYSAALRQLRGDQSLAKDVSQTVFIDFARKAKSLAGRELLAGWLYTSTQLAASNALRVNLRRQIREQKAVAMQETANHPQDDQTNSDLKIALDDAMSKLDSAERNAVLLRFFQGKELKEVGTMLGVSEDAARMRVNRSLGKLHTLLTAKGVTLSATALGAILAAEAVSAAPVGLVASVAEAALAGAATGAATTLTVAKILTMTKLKIGIVSAVVVAGVATPFVAQQKAQARLRQENQSLRQTITGLEASNAAIQRVVQPAPLQTETQSLAGDQLRELLRLRGEVAELRADTRELAILKTAHSRLTNNPVVQDALDTEVRLAKLKQLIKERPNLTIPEFYLLNNGDLRGAAREFDLDAEDGVRAAFARLRNHAENMFAILLQPALAQYSKAHNGQAPEKVEELAPFFDPPVDPTMLARYAVLHFDPQLVKGGWQGGWVVSQAQPVDEMDMRWTVSPVGFSPEPFEQTKQN